MSANKELSTQVIPDLDDLEEETLPINYRYWEPRKEKDMPIIKGIVLGFKSTEYEKVDKDGVISFITLECAEIAAQRKDKKGAIYYDILRNGGVLLVESLKNAIESGRVIPAETPIKIEYTGMRGTKNGNSMDTFNITVLRTR